MTKRKTDIRKHTRRIKGKKKVKVRKHRRKVNKARISKRKRKVFTSLATLPFETAGQLDFEDRDLDNARVHFGSASEVIFPVDPDFEVSYHTHIRKASIMPSFDDLISMRDTEEKENLIFNNNLALSIAEKEKFQNISTRKLLEVDKMMGRDARKGMSDRQMFEKYKSIFRKELGLMMKWHKPNIDIKLESEAI